MDDHVIGQIGHETFHVAFPIELAVAAAGTREMVRVRGITFGFGDEPRAGFQNQFPVIEQTLPLGHKLGARQAVGMHRFSGATLAALRELSGTG